jgi:tetratricopeptide (TPR) repeat protein
MILNKIAYLLIISVFVKSSFSYSLSSDQLLYIKDITGSILNCRFDHALKTTDSLIKVYPNDPLPTVLKLASLGMRDVDAEITVDSTQFITTYKVAVKNLEKYKSSVGENSYTQTMDGFTKAIYATYYLRRKMYMASLSTGLDAISLLKDAKKNDLSNTDVDFFLGLYDYAKSELKKKLWWVIFWYPGDKKEGINKLKQCAQSAFITKDAALLSLADIYIAEKQYDSAQAILSQLDSRFPDSRFVLWAKSKYYENIKQYSDAAICFGKLSESYSRIENGYINQMNTKNRQAHMLAKSGELDKARDLCNDILSSDLKVKKDIRKDTERLLEYLNESES